MFPSAGGYRLAEYHQHEAAFVGCHRFDGGERICMGSIVDDDRLVREGLTGLMRSAGFATEAFASAEEFLSLAHRDNIACLILDVGLTGISGLELQSQLTTVSNHQTPVVFMTARDDEATRQRALKGSVSRIWPSRWRAARPLVLDH